MDISINEQNQEHIKRKVKSGRYKTPDDVMAKALALLDERDEALAEELADVEANVQEGFEARNSGDYTEYTDETLHELFDDINRQGRERMVRARR